MRNITFIVSLVAFMACGGGSKPKNTAAEGQDEKRIEMPKMPAVFTSNEERGEYLAVHFWDNYDFKDTTYLNQDVTEQHFVDYLNLLNNIPPATGKKALNVMIDKAVEIPEVYSYFNEMFEKYLYEANSPMRNEELYIPVLERLIASDKVDDLEKIRPRSQLAMAMKNRPGTKAADVSFRLASGKTMRLYDVRADFVLLYINNPDCTACRELTAAIKQSPVIMPLVNQGVLKIVMIYPDEDIEAWRKNRDDIPSEWINGYNKEMRKLDIYDLKAIPTLYLLDRNKNVLVKDAASPQPVEYYFESAGY